MHLGVCYQTFLDFIQTILTLYLLNTFLAEIHDGIPAEIVFQELVNKPINRKVIERNQQIEQRLLKAEKALLEREKEEKRKSEEFKGKVEKRKIDELKYEEMMKHNEDFLKYLPIEYQDYYKKKVNKYFMNN